jgi:hypothetical protein
MNATMTFAGIALEERCEECGGTGRLSSQNWERWYRAGQPAGKEPRDAYGELEPEETPCGECDAAVDGRPRPGGRSWSSSGGGRVADSTDRQPGERIEYRRRGAPPLACGCPRMVHRVDRPDCLLKVWHRPGCTAGDLASTVPAPPPPRPAPGAIPCPECGNVASSWANGGPPARRCDGPADCGHVWTPARSAATSGHPATPEAPLYGQSRRKMARGST